MCAYENGHTCAGQEDWPSSFTLFVTESLVCAAHAWPLWSTSFSGFSWHSTGVLGLQATALCQCWASTLQSPCLHSLCYPLSLSLIFDKLLKVKTASDRKVTELIFYIFHDDLLHPKCNEFSTQDNQTSCSVKPLPEKDIWVRGRWGQKMNWLKHGCVP